MDNDECPAVFVSPLRVIRFPRLHVSPFASRLGLASEDASGDLFRRGVDLDRMVVLGRPPFAGLGWAGHSHPSSLANQDAGHPVLDVLYMLPMLSSRRQPLRETKRRRK